MLARSFSRASLCAANHARARARMCTAALVEATSAFARTPPPPPQHPYPFHLPTTARFVTGRRHMSSRRKNLNEKNQEKMIDVTPIGTKPWQIAAEAIAEAEAAEPLKDDEVGQDDAKPANLESGNPSEWEYNEATESGRPGGQDEANENPPTPILDAYERSKDPVEMERLIQMAFDSLPERAGPQRYNHKKREKLRYKTIRNIKYKEKAQRMAAYERKLQKRRDRKAREQALFATWRGTGDSDTASAAATIKD